ncbi:MAG: DivIVA domain-containing protein [Clostridia bacterium]|nr:DivIVA domain-containing protein [Clostridia bacterium]
MEQRITVDLISSKEFTTENRGYNRKEVDEFLDEVCDEMERMEAEIQNLRQKNTAVRENAAAAAAPAGPSAADESRFREILEMAATVKEETIRKAKEDAEAIRAKAEAEATERLDGLNEERDALMKEVTGLKKVAADFRTQFEALLQAQQKALDDAAGLFAEEA